MAEVNTKQWWISELNVILAGSNFEAIDNPTVNEDNVVVVAKGTTRPHHIGIKPKKNGNFGMWAKKEYVDALPKELVPKDNKPKGQVLHFVSINNLEFAKNVARVLAGDTVSTVSDKLKFIIGKYKENFATVDKQERYKWQAVAWYKQHWDLDATDFAQMVTVAFEKADNLLASGMYYAYKMLTEFANADPEKVREIFRTLYDESIPFADRYDTFRGECDSYIKQLKAQTGKDYNHYQDLHAISVYLFFEYPEKYFIYKSTMYTKMRERIGFVEEKSNEKSIVRKYENHARMCELILEEIHDDTELRELSEKRLDDTCYKDEQYHLLAMDIAYYGGIYMEDEDFGRDKEITYWPSLEEYDPEMSAEQWKSFLIEDCKEYPSTLKMLKTMLELGGEATCNKLAEVLGSNAQAWSSRGSSLGRRAKNKYNLPPCFDGDVERFFPIPFVGRQIKDLYSWKLRDELKEALESMELNIIESVTDVELNTILYGPPGTGKTYHTAIYAVAIIENKKLAEVAAEEYDEVLARYNEYKKNGKIAFTTFHQSYGYEEFIEGIKPVVTTEEDENKSDVQYAVASGIFKNFCDKAIRRKSISQVADYGLNESPNIWKVPM